MKSGGPIRGIAVLVPVLALAFAAALTGCASTGASGPGTVTAVNTPTVLPTLTTEQFDAAVAQRKPQFKAAAKAFRKCDRKVASDSFVSSPCLAKVVAETAVVDDALADLSAVQVPASAAATVKDLKKLAAAGAAVAKKCAKANDQTCDQALAAFRANEQSVLWDLDITL